MGAIPVSVGPEGSGRFTWSDWAGTAKGLWTVSQSSRANFDHDDDTPDVATPGASALGSVMTGANDIVLHTPQIGTAEPDLFTFTATDAAGLAPEAALSVTPSAEIQDLVPFLVGGEEFISTADGAGLYNTAMDVATFADGRQVQVWSEAGAPGSASDQLSFRFFENGVPVGTPVSIIGTSAADVSAISEAQVAVLNNGDFVVVWSDDGGVEAQIFDASGVSGGTKFLVAANSTDPDGSTHQALLPAVTALSNGGFAVAFETRDVSSGGQRTDGAGGNTWDAAGQMTGTLTIPGEVAQFTDYAKNPTPQVSIVDIGDGNVLLTWLDRVTDNLIGRIESGDGSLVKEFVIHPDVFHSLANYRDMGSGHLSLDEQDLQNWSVSSARLSNGNLVVAWTEDVHPHYAIVSPEGTVLLVRQLAAEDDNSSPTIGSFSANSVDVAVLDDGRFVLTWTNDDNEGFLPDGTVQSAAEPLNGNAFIKARIFNPDGSVGSSTTDFIVNQSALTVPNGDSLPGVIAPHIVATDADGFTINWTAVDQGSAGATASHAVTQTFEYPVIYPYGQREIYNVYYGDPDAPSASAEFMTDTLPVNSRNPSQISYFRANGGVSDSGTMLLATTASNLMVTSVVATFDPLKDAFQLDARVGHEGEWTFDVPDTVLASIPHGTTESVTVAVAVQDGNGGEPAQTEYFEVTNNTAPVFVSTAVDAVVQTTGGGINLSGIIQGFDADSDAITFTHELVESVTGSVAATLSSAQKIHIKDAFQFTIDGNWTYALSAADAPVLAHGEALVLTVPVAVTDDFWAFTVQKEVITFIGPDTAAVAHNDAFTATAGGKLTIAAAGLLANDTDAENDPLTATLVTGPTHGTLTLNAKGAFVYAPDAGFTGTDSFQYRADDGILDGSVATVSLVVEPNKAPVITSDGGGKTATKSVHENDLAVTKIMATDANSQDNLTYSIILPRAGNGAGADGRLFVLDAATHLLSFKTAPDFEAPADAGDDNTYEVTVRVADGNGGTDEQTIAVSVLNVLAENGDATANVFNGTVANDAYNGRAGNDTIRGHGGRDKLSGGNGNDVLNGGTASDTLDGGAGRDSLYGGANNDLLTGGLGNDRISGGGGVDTARFVGPAAATVNLALTTAQNTGYGSDTLLKIENVASGAGNDRLSGNAAANMLIAGHGNDTLFGGGGDDTLFGGGGNDALNGGFGDDKLTGGAGVDTAYFLGAADAHVSLRLTAVQNTGYGHDILRGIENVSSDSGNDLLTGNSLANTLNAGAGSDTLHGGGGKDRLSGGSGNDTLDAGNGNDTVFGGNGRDKVFLGAGADVFVDNAQGGSRGIDTVSAGAGNDLVKGGAGNDVFSGNGGNDRLFGGAGNDKLAGGSGFDLLTGGGGADTLTGGGGADTLTGGRGADTFVFGLGFGHDLITDFADDTDQIKFLSGLWAGTRTAAEVIADYAQVDGSSVVFDFGGNDVLRVAGVADPSALLNDLVLA